MEHHISRRSSHLLPKMPPEGSIQQARPCSCCSSWLRAGYPLRATPSSRKGEVAPPGCLPDDSAPTTGATNNQRAVLCVRPFLRRTMTTNDDDDQRRRQRPSIIRRTNCRGAEGPAASACRAAKQPRTKQSGGTGVGFVYPYPPLWLGWEGRDRAPRCSARAPLLFSPRRTGVAYL